MFLIKHKLFIKLTLAFFVCTIILPINLAQAGVVSENLLINPSFEEKGATYKEALGWQPFNNGYKRVLVFQDGSWGIKLKNTTTDALSGAYQRIDLNQTEIKPVFIGGNVRGKNIVNSPGGYMGASLYAEIHLQDGSVVYWNSVANTGSFWWRWIGFNTSTLTIDGVNKLITQPISHIFVVPVLGYASGIAFFDSLTVKEYEPTQAAVTLMFDDGEDSAYTIAKPILDNFNFKASAAVIVNNINKEGNMTLNEIKDLQNNGWEIVSHSMSHQDLTTLSNLQARREMRRSKNWLSLFGLNVNNFALPYGTYNGYIIGESDRYYRSTRAYELGDNPQGLYANDVKVRSVYNTTTPAEVQAWIDEAQANKSWVVLVFHTIAETGSDAYYTTPDIFTEMINTVASSSIDVVTYNQGLDLFQAN